MILLGFLFAVCDFTYIRIALEFTRLQENEFQEVLPWKTTQYYVYDISRSTICKQARHIRYAMKNARLVYSCNILQNIVANVFDVDFGSIASSTCWANKIRQSGLGVWGHFNLHALPSPIHQHPLHFNSGHAICKKMPNIHPPANKVTTNVSTALSLK